MAHTLLLIVHIGLIAMGTGMSFSNLVNLRLSRGVAGDMAKGLALQRRTVSRMGDGIIAAIWVTGLALIWSGGVVVTGWLAVKIAAVVLLTVCHALARRTAGAMARGGNGALLPRLDAFVAGVWLSALAAIVLAVVAFR